MEITFVPLAFSEDIESTPLTKYVLIPSHGLISLGLPAKLEERNAEIASKS